MELEGLIVLKRGKVNICCLSIIRDAMPFVFMYVVVNVPFRTRLHSGDTEAGHDVSPVL